MSREWAVVVAEFSARATDIALLFHVRGDRYCRRIRAE
jgi:hypothetical protein